jgi:hypothetical protein
VGLRTLAVASSYRICGLGLEMAVCQNPHRIAKISTPDWKSLEIVCVSGGTETRIDRPTTSLQSLEDALNGRIWFFRFSSVSCSPSNMYSPCERQSPTKWRVYTFIFRRNRSHLLPRFSRSQSGIDRSRPPNQSKLRNRSANRQLKAGNRPITKAAGGPEQSI